MDVDSHTFAHLHDIRTSLLHPLRATTTITYNNLDKGAKVRFNTAIFQTGRTRKLEDASRASETCSPEPPFAFFFFHSSIAMILLPRGRPSLDSTTFYAQEPTLHARHIRFQPFLGDSNCGSLSHGKSSINLRVIIIIFNHVGPIIFHASRASSNSFLWPEAMANDDYPWIFPDVSIRNVDHEKRSREERAGYSEVKKKEGEQRRRWLEGSLCKGKKDESVETGRGQQQPRTTTRGRKKRARELSVFWRGFQYGHARCT